MLYVRGDDAPLGYQHFAHEAAVRALGVPLGRTRDDREVACAMVGQALVEADGAGRRISISRSGEWWKLRRYPGTPLGRERVLNVADRMFEAGYFHQHRAKQGAHLAERECDRLQSAYWATQKLIDAMRGEPVGYRAPRVPVLLRDDDGDPLPLPDTEKVRRIVRTMERRNEVLAGIDVTVDPKAAASGAWRFSDHHWHAMSASGNWTCVLSIETPMAVQMFARSDFGLHGRMYGQWSNLPKIRRAELLLNGEPVDEPDWSCLHLDLAYAMCGHRLDGDAYEMRQKIRGVSRTQLKGAVNTYINAADRLATIRSLMNKRYETGRDGRPVWPRRMTWDATAAALDRIEERHEPIRRLFGSDAGVRLMRIDSVMAGEVMDLSAKAAIPVLPVHDSFVSPRGKTDIVEGFMGEVLDRTRVRLSQGSSKGSVEGRLHRAPRAAEPLVPCRAEPVEVPLAEPRVAVPAEPRTPPAEPVGAFLAEPRVPVPSEPGTPPAEPVGAFLAEPRVPVPSEPGTPPAEPVGAFLAEPGFPFLRSRAALLRSPWGPLWRSRGWSFLRSRAPLVRSRWGPFPRSWRASSPSPRRCPPCLSLVPVPSVSGVSGLQAPASRWPSRRFSPSPTSRRTSSCPPRPLRLPPPVPGPLSTLPRSGSGRSARWTGGS